MTTQHPGAVLAWRLAWHGWSQVDLAAALGRPIQAVNEIVRGKKRITAEMAVQLGRVFGNPPEFWHYLQADWDLQHAVGGE